MTISQKVVEAAAFALDGHSWMTDNEVSLCACGEVLKPSLEYAGDAYRSHLAAIVLTAALPSIEKEIRAQVAAELRGELPVQLAETAHSRTGWLSDAQVWLPEPDALYERIELEIDGGNDVGSIDIAHIAEHAARIAEGADHD